MSRDLYVFWIFFLPPIREQRRKGPSCLGLKHYNNSKVFIKYSNDMDERNPNKEHKILIMFDDIIADMFSDKKLQQIITKLFLAFITQFYFAVAKYIRLNSTNYFIMKNLSKRELQQIPNNHSSDIDFKEMYCKRILF